MAVAPPRKKAEAEPLLRPWGAAAKPQEKTSDSIDVIALMIGGGDMVDGSSGGAASTGPPVYDNTRCSRLCCWEESK